MEEFFHFFITAVRQTSFMEWAAIVTALLYVVLAARENPWCWLFGILSSAVYTWFNFHLRLNLDAILSLYYCLVGIYGWYFWIRGGTNDQKAPVRRASLPLLLTGTLGAAVAAVIFGWLSKNYFGSALPYADAALTVFSLLATWMTARKLLENWLFWVVIDAGYVIIYFMRSAPMSALLYLIYVIIAAWAFFKWRKQYLESNA